MAYFCEKSGVRIVAPGVSKSAGGDVPEHDGSDASIKAEQAAIEALRLGRKSAEEIVPSAVAIDAAVTAAADVLRPKIVDATKIDASKPTIPLKPERGGRGQ